jgi:hypothetical protein
MRTVVVDLADGRRWAQPLEHGDECYLAARFLRVVPRSAVVWVHQGEPQTVMGGRS